MIRATVLTLLLLSGSALADPADRAGAAAEELRAAGEALTEADGARDRVAALTETIRAYEAGLAAFRDALRDTAIREAALRDRLDSERDRIARVLAALHTVSRSPETTVLLHPSGALGTARASMLMADATPALHAEIAALAVELDELRVLTVLREDARDTLEEALQGVQAARTDLGRAMSERLDLPPRLATDEAAMQALINSTETLDAFAASVAGADGPDSPADFAAARGSLGLPVAGEVIAGFGQSAGNRPARPGLTIATAPRALVSAPAAATVRYAGPLLDFGNVMILEPADGYLIVIAGFSDVFTPVGAIVPQGAPLGLTAGRSPGAQEILIETASGSGQDRPETLYMELRTPDGPVDPAGWFAL